MSPSQGDHRVVALMGMGFEGVDPHRMGMGHGRGEQGDEQNDCLFIHIVFL
jgi:hypothetical protein